MKISICDAAQSLRLHPLEFVLDVARLTQSFDEIYPEVDEGYVATLKQMQGMRHSFDTEQLLPKAASLPGLSEDAKCLVSAMKRKGHWGKNTVGKDTLKNHYCRNLRDFDSAIKELLKANMVAYTSLAGPFSLNTKTKTQIEKITGQLS